MRPKLLALFCFSLWRLKMLFFLLLSSSSSWQTERILCKYKLFLFRLLKLCSSPLTSTIFPFGPLLQGRITVSGLQIEGTRRRLWRPESSPRPPPGQRRQQPQQRPPTSCTSAVGSATSPQQTCPCLVL